MFQANVSLWLLCRKDGECDDSKGKILCNVSIVALKLWREYYCPCVCEDLHLTVETSASSNHTFSDSVCSLRAGEKKKDARNR